MALNPGYLEMSDELRNTRWDAFVVRSEFNAQTREWWVEVRVCNHYTGYSPPDYIDFLWDNQSPPPQSGVKVQVRCVEMWGWSSKLEQLDFFGGATSLSQFFAARYIIRGAWALEMPDAD